MSNFLERFSKNLEIKEDVTSKKSSNKKKKSDPIEREMELSETINSSDTFFERESQEEYKYSNIKDIPIYLYRASIESLKKIISERKFPFLIMENYVKGLTVSTTYHEILGYQTSIIDAKRLAIPIDRYTSKYQAEIGHYKWCERAKTLTKVRMLYPIEMNCTGIILSLSREDKEYQLTFS